jgi:hypothetical protein
MEQKEHNIPKKDLDLLVKELCARLPYGVKFCQTDVSTTTLKSIGFGRFGLIPINLFYKKPEFYLVNEFGRLEYKPYLRPISTMTEEEMDMLFDILKIDKDGNDEDWIKINDDTGIKFFFPTGKWIENVAEAYDYLYSIHIDFRGLIHKGLALEAPAEMYK